MKLVLAITMMMFSLVGGVATPSAHAEGKAEAGFQLAQKNCTPCHVIVSDDTETMFEIAPRFEELTKKTEEQLRARLMMRHVMMPQFPTLTLQNVADISAYLKSLAGK